jgi:hypothetical protein
VPYQIEYHPAGAEVKYSGHVLGDEILEAKRQFFAHRFDGDAHYVLCDFTGAETYDISPESVDAIIQQDRAAMADHERLHEVVVAPKALVYGLSRMWQIRVDTVRPHTAVVRTRPEALRWLKEVGVAALLRDAGASIEG